MLEILSADSETYPETVTAARKAADKLKATLGPKILGKKVREGTMKEATATEVIPPATDSRIAEPSQWSVKVQMADGRTYSAGLVEVLKEDEIKALFGEHFAGVDTDYLGEEQHRQEFRAKGVKIDITANNADAIAEGRRIMDFHSESQSHLSGFKELRKQAEVSNLYMALIGAIYSAKPGDVISVPTEAMRDFAHKYMAFANVATYLLVECGKTVSVRGVVQNVRRRVADIASPASA
jgi:hypothetical protein